MDIAASSTTTINTFNNGVVGGVRDGTMPGFDGNQYQHNGNSATQQQSKVMDLPSAFSTPVPSAPMSSGGPEQQQHPQKHKKNESGDLITTITNAASARLATAAAERDNEKRKDKCVKHAKKSYPSVGIRVRVAKDGSVIRPQRAQATTTASGGQMQAPPPRHNADAVLAFQQQQKQRLQGTTPTQVAPSSQHSQTSPQTSSPSNVNMMDEHRSRSSSFSHAQPQPLQTEDVNPQSMDLPLPFVSSPEQMNIQAMPPKDYAIHDTNSQRQHPRHHSYGSTHMFDAQSQPLYEQSQPSFDPITGPSGGSADGMSYNQNQVSSPFSNGSGAISASSSPFTATSSGHPTTPTFPSHHSTPPIFGPPPPTSTTSSATYFRGSSFSSYATNSPTLQSSNLAALQQQHGNGSGMPLIDIGMDPTMMPPILETPIYDKSQQQQHAMYDPKPSVVDNMSRHHHHQQHFQQHSSYDDGSQNHRHMVPVMPPWSSPPPLQQSSISTQNDQSFWNNGDGFKFYS